MKRRLISTVLIACFLAGSTGCSWIWMTRLPQDHQPSQEPDCSDWYLWPIIDALYLVSYVAVTAGLHAEGIGGDNSTSVFSFAAPMIPAMIHFHSALGGFVWARDCNVAIDEHEQWLDRDRRIRKERAGEPVEAQQQ